MKLRSDPYIIFRKSKTPVGLYARKKWLKESHRSNYKDDFDDTVRLLSSGQSSDGSWQKSPIKTIKRLFDFHLTVRDETESVRKALDWLVGQTLELLRGRRIHLPERISWNDLDSLPFTKGSDVLLISSATLFLASVFGHSRDPHILQIYEWLQARGADGDGRRCGWNSFSNILRAFVVHPDYSKRRFVELAVENLKEIQQETGLWVRSVPFYQTVNALAHLQGPRVEEQLIRAFNRLFRTQRNDGTWSRAQPEWNSFLVIHALKNKGEL